MQVPPLPKYVIKNITYPSLHNQGYPFNPQYNYITSLTWQNKLVKPPNTLINTRWYPRSETPMRVHSNQHSWSVTEPTYRRGAKWSQAQTKMPCHHFYPHIFYIVNLDDDFWGWFSGSPSKNSMTVISNRNWAVPVNGGDTPSAKVCTWLHTTRELSPASSLEVQLSGIHPWWNHEMECSTCCTGE